jgi:hypothetical protein
MKKFVEKLKKLFGFFLKGKKAEVIVVKPWPADGTAPKVELLVHRVFEKSAGGLIQVEPGTYQLVRISILETDPLWYGIEGLDAQKSGESWKALHRNGLVNVL